MIPLRFEQYSRRRIGAFARSVGSNAAEYFDPVIAGYDGYRDVIAPAVFSVVPGQHQLDQQLEALGSQYLPLLHGVHIDIANPIVAGIHLSVQSEQLTKKETSGILAATGITTIRDAKDVQLAVVTQKLALVPKGGNSNGPGLSEGFTPVKREPMDFEISLTQNDLSEYVTVSDDQNPVHNNSAYATSLGFSAPLAQGMLLLGRAISHLEDKLGTYLMPKLIQARFFRPIPVAAAGTSVQVSMAKQDNSYQLAFYQDSHRVARANLEL